MRLLCVEGSVQLPGRCSDAVVAVLQHSAQHLAEFRQGGSDLSGGGRRCGAGASSPSTLQRLHWAEAELEEAAAPLPDDGVRVSASLHEAGQCSRASHALYDGLQAVTAGVSYDSDGDAEASVQQWKYTSTSLSKAARLASHRAMRVRQASRTMEERRSLSCSDMAPLSCSNSRPHSTHRLRRSASSLLSSSTPLSAFTRRLHSTFTSNCTRRRRSSQLSRRPSATLTGGSAAPRPTAAAAAVVASVSASPRPTEGQRSGVESTTRPPLRSSERPTAVSARRWTAAEATAEEAGPSRVATTVGKVEEVGEVGDIGDLGEVGKASDSPTPAMALAGLCAAPALQSPSPSSKRSWVGPMGRGMSDWTVGEADGDGDGGPFGSGCRCGGFAVELCWGVRRCSGGVGVGPLSFLLFESGVDGLVMGMACSSLSSAVLCAPGSSATPHTWARWSWRGGRRLQGEAASGALLWEQTRRGVESEEGGGEEAVEAESGRGRRLSPSMGGGCWWTAGLHRR